jgi:uncharacterized protein YdiU (UPF0061 family)
MKELEMIVFHLIDREYADVIDQKLTNAEKVIALAQAFRDRLTSLVANWIRVGYCQGNFNSDNCAAGGFTLDYGPFGFCDEFNSQYQPWSAGGDHFAFLNQPKAAEQNFKMFCNALLPLLESDQALSSQLVDIFNEFSTVMQKKMQKMWRTKLGLTIFNATLLNDLIALMEQTPVDYTLFFRELSTVPNNIEPLKNSFYKPVSEEVNTHWSEWFLNWKRLNACSDNKDTTPLSRDQLSKQMKLVNPKYSLREWFVAPAYQQAAEGNYTLVRELQDVITQPYAEQPKDVEEKYYRLKPSELFDIGGLSQYSCSS